MRLPRRLLVLLGAVLCVVLLAGAAVALARSASQRQQPTAARQATAMPSPACDSPAVRARIQADPLLYHATPAPTVTIPAGEPAIVATVNGVSITAIELETRVQTALEVNEQAPGTTVAQLRHEMLYKLIDSIVYRQEEQRLGVTISVAQARQAAQQQMDIYAKLPAGSPARVTMDAYLCSSGLTPQNYTDNPRVIQGFQEALAQGKLLQRGASHIQTLPPGVHSAQDAYTRQLEQAADIHIYIEV
jgi:hypothetical protein